MTSLFRHLRSWVVTAPVGTARYWLCLSVLVSRLGATRAAQAKILVVALLMPIRDALPGDKQQRPITFRLRLGERRVNWLVGLKSDVEVLNEVLVLGEYEGAPHGEPTVVLDLGSHIGVSLLFFRQRYPRARVIGVEPNPRIFPRLSQNVDQLEAVEVHQVAVAARDGELDFFPAKQAWVSSTRPTDDAKRPVKVRGRSLDGLLAELGLERVDLLKLDIEAGEAAVLAASTRLRDVGAVVGEFDDRGDPAQRRTFFALFDGFRLNITGGLGEHTTFVAVGPRWPSGVTSPDASGTPRA
jgi:FkbM family methyltransferase